MKTDAKTPFGLKLPFKNEPRFSRRSLTNPTSIDSRAEKTKW
jgi:hypothetical protein